MLRIKDCFYNELMDLSDEKKEDVHSVDDLVACLGEFNGYVDRYIDGFHGWYCVGQKNVDE